MSFLDRPKIVYIAHPMSGDIPGNVRKVIDILAKETSDVCYPIAPYLATFAYLDDSKAIQRGLGMDMNEPYFSRKFVDELWVYGWSNGTLVEMMWALHHGIPIIDKDKEKYNTLINEMREGR